MKIRNPQEVKNQIRRHYKEADLWLPYDSSHRHFRVRVIRKNGEVAWRKIKDVIDSKETLRKHLVSLAPLDVYFTISRWLDPANLGKKNERTRDVLLGSDYVVDIDDPEVQKAEVIKDFLRSKGYRDLYTVFTGNGFHVRKKRFFEPNVELPKEREERCWEKMKELTEEMVDKDLPFDYYINKGNDGEEHINSPSLDTRRIVKYCGITKYGNLSKRGLKKTPKKIDMSVRKPVNLKELEEALRKQPTT